LIPLAKRNEIKEANPEAGPVNISQLVNLAWKAYSEEDKKVFITLAEEDKGKSKNDGLLVFFFFFFLFFGFVLFVGMTHFCFNNRLLLSAV